MNTIVRRNGVPRLAPRLAATIAAKCVLLLVLWLAFFHHHEVAVDAGSVAAAFGLSATAADAGGPPGGHHGQ